MTSEAETPTPDDSAEQERLYRHTSKPQWGLALLAWERDGKRAYQFEDGKLRVFKEGYFQLLEPVDRPADETEVAIRELNTKLGRKRAAKRNGRTEPAIPLSKQIDLFVHLYADGFEGDDWVSDKRGVDVENALKRHREPVMKRARELFTKERLLAAAEDNALSLIEDIAEIIESTDLVTKAQTRGLSRATEPLARRVAAALHEVLYGEGEMTLRFERYVGSLGRAIGKKASWQLATLIPALVDPATHICVKPSAMKTQAVWMAPSLVIGKTPSGAIYTRILEMVAVLVEKLTAAGHKPRDLMDVYDFMWTTLRPKAQSMIAEGIPAPKPEAAPSEAPGAETAQPESAPAES